MGDGPVLGVARRVARVGGMSPWLQLPGRLDHAAIKSLLSEADVFVAPAVLESFGLAALEARVAGLPVVARTRTGIADFVTSGQEGLLCGNTGELTRAVARLCADAELRERMIAHNRTSTPQRCSWPAVLGAFEDCYARARDLAQCRIDWRRRGG